MNSDRAGNTPVFWLQDTSSLVMQFEESYREAARLSAQVKQDADFVSESFKPSTLDDCIEQRVQPKNKKEVSADDDYWNSSAHVAFNFEEDADDDGRRNVQFNKKPQSSGNDQRKFGFDELNRVTAEVCGIAPLASGSNLRHADLGNIQKHAERLKIGHDVPTKGVKSVNTPEETVRNIVIGQTGFIIVVGSNDTAMIISLYLHSLCDCDVTAIARLLKPEQPYFLGRHRSKEDKIALLNEAVRIQDGNAIIAVLLFLKQTLKSSLFNQELMQRPKAVSHYLSHLRAVHDNSQLMDVLGMLGRTEDAAMIKYKLAVETPEAATKLRNLQSCYKSHFQSDPSLEMQAEVVREELKLLEMQLVIEEDDSKAEKEGLNILMQEFPRKAPVVGTSLVTTLYYCCLYHYNVSNSHIASPTQMKALFNLTEKQFVWTALTALAQIKHWKEIDNLFQGKSWLGKSKMRCCIGFDRAVEILAKAHAPPEVFEKYLQMVDDAEKRFTLAKLHKCHGVAIETLVYLRDRQRLLRYKGEVPPHSIPYFEIERLLSGTAVKWKN